jgi:hypothetical protein
LLILSTMDYSFILYKAWVWWLSILDVMIVNHCKVSLAVILRCDVSRNKVVTTGTLLRRLHNGCHVQKGKTIVSCRVLLVLTIPRMSY